MDHPGRIPSMDEKIMEFAGICQKCVQNGSITSLTFYDSAEGNLLKARGKCRIIGGETVLQLERQWSEGRVTHENISAEKIADTIPQYIPSQFRKADLVTRNGTASLLCSQKGKITLLTKGNIRSGGEKTQMQQEGNDRDKNRLLTGAEPFLYALDLSDKNGRVHDKRQPKFRQICRFTEYIRDAAERLPKTGGLYIADLCCGKSYLSFAVYHYLTAVLHREVYMDCVDRKASVMAECAEIAEKLGYTGMHFTCGDIFDYIPKERPHMVISLHACDTATDAVLEVAMKTRAQIILSTPCCHHEMNRLLDCPTLDFIGERPMLRQKFCDAATDALRLLRLDAMGYKTDATELIDPEDTPKNILLRGFLRPRFDRNAPEAVAKWERYRTAYRFLYGMEPPVLPEYID